jgi:hypothetical protein
LRASPWKHVTGLLLGDGRIVTTTLVVTPLGARRVGGAEERVEEDDLPGALLRLREGGHLRGRVVCGIDARRSYTTTRKLSPDEAERRPAELLEGLLGLEERTLVAGSEPVKLPAGVHAALASCPRAPAAVLLEGLGAARRPPRLAPMTWVLHQRACKLKGRPRKWRTDVRILPGKESGLAILSHGSTPVASRHFDIEEGSNAAGPIALAVLGLLTHAREELALAGVDGVLFHAGEEGKEAAEACEAATGLKTVVAPLLGTDAEAGSLALAYAGVRPKQGALDLFQELLPPPTLMHRLPLRSAAALGVAGLVLGWMLGSEASDLESEASKLEKQAAGNLKRAHVQLADLKKVHENLRTEVQIAQSFITNRLRWGDFLRELPTVLPPAMVVVDFDGRDTVRYPSKKKSADINTKGRQLIISGEVPLDEADSSPPEVAVLTEAIKQSPVFQAALPRITGANVRLLPAVKGLFARITVLCLPPGAGGKT